MESLKISSMVIGKSHSRQSMMWRLFRFSVWIVLGIKPIPNIDKKISDLIAKYRAESIDIDDIEFEEPDVMDWADFQEINENETDS